MGDAIIILKSPGEIDAIKVACRMAAETLLSVGPLIRPGVTGTEIDKFVHEDTIQRGGIPAPLNYKGFPRSVCISINDVVCHGIPNDRKFEDGDIVNIDITTIYDRYHGDTSATFYVGRRGSEAVKTVETARKALELGIAAVKDGSRLGDIGSAIQKYAESEGCSVVRDFFGHGIGRNFHEPPHVAHFGIAGRGIRLKTGFVFTIEPMINFGQPETNTLPDGWTAVTQDGSLSAQFEHTIAMTKDGPEVLTTRSRPLINSED
jgi:methionyl aminopeptidase